jgi:PAS domain S-box-containing protein
VLASWNHAAERIYGWKAEEVIGKSGAEILQTEFLTISRPEAIKQLIESGEYNAEVSQPRKDGTKIYIETRTTALRDTNGKTIGYVSINRDITERKEAEKKLRLSEELFSNAFHASPAGIVITRIADGKIIDANESFLNMFEFSRAETIGHTSIELNIFTPEERAKIIQQQIASGGLQNFEFTSRTKSGKPINLLSSSKPMEIKGELCHITTMIDITERKRAEETLRMRVNELAALYKTSQSLQKLLEPEPLSQEIVELLEKTLSYEYGAVLLIEEPGTRMIPFAVVGLERGEEFIRQDKEFIASRSVEVGKGVTGWVAQHGESALIGDVRKDPRYYALRENIKSEMCAPLRTGDKVIGVINVESPRLNAYNENDLRVLETVAAQISISIPNARLLEETRLSRDRLAELSRRLVETHESEQRAIGRELHDQIGQMLTALKLTLEIAAQLPPEAAAKKIVTANELVDDLMSRVSRLSLELRPPMLDELGLIPALLWQVNRFQEQSGIVVDFKHTGMEGKRFDPEIETTAYRIVQESLTNVARHSRATRVGLEVRAGGGQVEILIEDNGKGFDPQAALAKNRGLSGMRERAGLVGGTFEIQSEPGKGTRKFLRLPLRESAA